MIDLLIENWLKKKENNYTQRQYRSSITSFRTFIKKEVNLDLFDDIKLVQICAQIWASHSQKNEEISLSTIKSRISIISAFYEFAIRSKVIKFNPIHDVGKSVIKQTKTDLTSMNTETLEGKRNYALVLLARETCKPFAQLADIKLCDLTLLNELYSVHWKKTNSQSSLSLKTSQALLEYLKDASEFIQTQESKIWISFSNRNKHNSISQKTVSNICTGKLDRCRNSLEISEVVKLYRSGHSVFQIQTILMEGKKDEQFFMSRSLHQGST